MGKCEHKIFYLSQKLGCIPLQVKLYRHLYATLRAEMNRLGWLFVELKKNDLMPKNIFLACGSIKPGLLCMYILYYFCYYF